MKRKTHHFKRQGNGSTELTTDELQRAIVLEKEWSKALHKSIYEWSGIVQELDSGLEISPAIDSSWRTKYSKQRLHNNTLRQQIKALQAEVDHVKHRLQRANRVTPTDEKLSRLEQQKHLRDMSREAYNLKSFEKMYERQLDDTAREYNGMKEAIETIAKDVWFNQGNRITVQEDRDKRVFRRIKKARKTNSTIGLDPEHVPRNRQSLTKVGSSYFDLYNKCTRKGKRPATKPTRKSKECSEMRRGKTIQLPLTGDPFPDNDDEISSEESYEYVVIDDVRYKRSIPKRRGEKEDKKSLEPKKPEFKHAETKPYPNNNMKNVLRKSPSALKKQGCTRVSKIPVLKVKIAEKKNMERKTSLCFETSVSSIATEVDKSDSEYIVKEDRELIGDHSVAHHQDEIRTETKFVYRERKDGEQKYPSNTKRVSIDNVPTYYSF